MKIKIWIISAVLISVLAACDDGDLIVTSFDFEDQDLQLCDGASNLVFFKINNETQESIALNIVATSEIFLQEEISPITLSESNFVTYRKFNSDVDASYFCSSVPPLSPGVSTEYIAENGIATVNNTLVLDDEDGVPEEIEKVIDPLTGLLLDTDRDGIPNYYDADDDGDNVPTLLELDNGIDEDGNIIKVFKYTDDDDTPDHLDVDDDNDGVCTRDESTDGDIDPLNDMDDDGLADYLNDQVSILGTNTLGYIEHTYMANADVELILSNLDLVNTEEKITQEVLNMGILMDAFNVTILVTPDYEDGFPIKCNQ